MVAIFFCSLKYRCRSFRTVTLCCPFFLPAYLLLPSFPVAKFSVAHFSGCRFFCCLFSVAVISDINFLLPFFPYRLIFRCRILPLPNFPLPFFRCSFYSCPFYRCRYYLLPYHSLTLSVDWYLSRSFHTVHPSVINYLLTGISIAVSF